MDKIRFAPLSNHGKPLLDGIYRGTHHSRVLRWYRILSIYSSGRMSHENLGVWGWGGNHLSTTRYLSWVHSKRLMSDLFLGHATRAMEIQHRRQNPCFGVPHLHTSARNPLMLGYIFMLIQMYIGFTITPVKPGSRTTYKS